MTHRPQPRTSAPVIERCGIGSRAILEVILLPCTFTVTEAQTSPQDPFADSFLFSSRVKNGVEVVNVELSPR